MELCTDHVHYVINMIRSMVHCSVLSVKNLCGCSGCRLCFVKKTKRHDNIFSVIELFPLLVAFSPLKYLLWEKYCS